MKLFVTRTLLGLQPCTSTDFDNIQAAKLKLGEIYEVEIKRKRNYEFHKKYFALLTITFQNQKKLTGISFDEFRAYVTMKAGYYKTVTTDKGMFTLPKSISFSSMDNIEFDDLYQKTIDVCISLLDCNKENIIDAVLNFS